MRFLVYSIPILLCIPMAVQADCKDFRVVCGVKHGHAPSTDSRDWSLGHHNEKFEWSKTSGCHPYGGSHCGDHHVLTYQDMPHNSVKTDSCYAKAAERRSDGCSAPDDPVSQLWSSVFYSACHLHDICYSIKSASKDQCDRDLHNNWLAICDKLPDHVSGYDPAVNRTNCKTAVGVWKDFFGNKKFHEAYEHDQKWAKEKCS